MGLQAQQLLTAHHSSTGFNCGDHSINQWLRQRALANQASGATRTFVVCGAEGDIRAFVALASGADAVNASSGRFKRNMPYPIPVVVLARLAVCGSLQGQGLARVLLAGAFERVLLTSEQIGVRGILVHDASPAARACRYGTNETLKLLCQSFGAHQLLDGLLRIAADPLHLLLLAGMTSVQAVPPGVRLSNDWARLVEQDMLDSAPSCLGNSHPPAAIPRALLAHQPPSWPGVTTVALGELPLQLVMAQPNSAVEPVPLAANWGGAVAGDGH